MTFRLIGFKDIYDNKVIIKPDAFRFMIESSNSYEIYLDGNVPSIQITKHDVDQFLKDLALANLKQ